MLLEEMSTSSFAIWLSATQLKFWKNCWAAEWITKLIKKNLVMKGKNSYDPVIFNFKCLRFWVHPFIAAAIFAVSFLLPMPLE